jgi:peroxiredoxin
MLPRVHVATLVASAVVSLVAAGCGPGGSEGEGASSAEKQSHPLLGKHAPEFTAETVGGDGPKTLKAAHGKVLILDFWATFCDPCKKSFPKYQEIVDTFAGDVTILAVSIDEPDNVTKEQLLRFAKEHHAKFAIVWDKDGNAVEKYGVKSLKMPSSFVIDTEGTVRHLHVGFHDGEEAKITQEVKELVK